ncbi:MAG: hypothetical protein SXA11_04700 [Cyanobacteriota bacterium]|nr:hypothetical protein [Cyanobacteriota bacterium]
MTKETANYDEPWKAAIGEYFPQFLEFFYPDIHAEIDWQKQPISLDKELEQITASSETEKRYADKLFKVWRLSNDEEIWILIHIEVQSQYETEFAQRMFVYNYRAFDLYRKPVIGLAILGDNRPSWKPNSYSYGLKKSQMKYEFAVQKLLDYQWEELERNPNPFAIVVMAHLKTQSTTKNLLERAEWKWELIKSLYERGYAKYEIANLFKFMDKMMTVTPELQEQIKIKIRQYEAERKVPFLSTMEEMAEKRGAEKTAKSTNKKSIINLLQKRFGELPETLKESVNKIEEISVLEKLLLETVSVSSAEEFEELIQENLSEEN